MLSALVNLLERIGLPPGRRAPAPGGGPAVAPAWPAPVRKTDDLILASAVWRKAYGTPAPAPSPVIPSQPASAAPAPTASRLRLAPVLPSQPLVLRRTAVTAMPFRPASLPPPPAGGPFRPC